ncbi:MAG: hypothetical protein M3N08_03240 [Pseudomonadota bacterium]|nr:hypothetical protein [Pseudomonadota bacterium]
MSKKGWFFGTVATMALSVAGAVTLETALVYDSDQVKNALKINSGQPESLGRDLWEETLKKGASFFSSLVSEPPIEEQQAQDFRSKARLLVGALPTSSQWSPAAREVANEEMARDMMARSLLLDSQGPLPLRLQEAFHALKEGKLPHVEPKPQKSVIKDFWNRLAGDSQPAPP